MKTENILQYRYDFLSSIIREPTQNNLLLAQYSEIEKGNASCYFQGQLNQPFTVARCLITLSNVVKSSFSMSPAQLAALKDPIVTAGNGQVRFEGFSHCAGVYARTDVLESGHNGEFPECGTTNVDFNQPMLSALGRIGKTDNMVLSVGQKEVGVHTADESIVERKVPLPVKWIKGLTTVQHYMSLSEPYANFNRLQAMQLFRTIPRGTIKVDYYLVKRGNQFIFSPVKMPNALVVGGIHRLHLLQPLLPLTDTVRVFAQPDGQSVTFQLYFQGVVFSFSLSRNPFRGFSGEGALLETLIEDVPTSLIEQMDNYSYVNQVFNPTMLAIETGYPVEKIKQLTSQLSAMGLLGFDLDKNSFYYRRLPYKPARIFSLNPRLKGAEKLLQENKVQIVSHQPDRTEARVEGSGVQHTVIFDRNTEKCTCLWYSQNQGERGACKHILAVKKKIQHNGGSTCLP